MEGTKNFQKKVCAAAVGKGIEKILTASAVGVASGTLKEERESKGITSKNVRKKTIFNA